MHSSHIRIFQFFLDQLESFTTFEIWFSSPHQNIWSKLWLKKKTDEKSFIGEEEHVILHHIKELVFSSASVEQISHQT